MAKKPTQVQAIPPAPPPHPLDRLPPPAGSQWLNAADLGRAYEKRSMARWSWLMAAFLASALAGWAALVLFSLLSRPLDMGLILELAATLAVMLLVALIGSLLALMAPFWRLAVPSGEYWLVFNSGRQAARALGGGVHYILPTQSAGPFRKSERITFHLTDEQDQVVFPPIINREGERFLLTGRVTFYFDPVAWSRTNSIEKAMHVSEKALVDELKDKLYESARLLIHPCSREQIWSDGLTGLYRELENFFREKAADGFSRVDWMLQIDLPQPQTGKQEIFNRLQAVGGKPKSELWMQLTDRYQDRWRVNLYGGRGKSLDTEAMPVMPESRAVRIEMPAEPPAPPAAPPAPDIRIPPFAPIGSPPVAGRPADEPPARMPRQAPAEPTQAAQPVQPYMPDPTARNAPVQPRPAEQDGTRRVESPALQQATTVRQTPRQAPPTEFSDNPPSPPTPPPPPTDPPARRLRG